MASKRCACQHGGRVGGELELRRVAHVDHGDREARLGHESVHICREHHTLHVRSVQRVEVVAELLHLHLRPRRYRDRARARHHRDATKLRAR